MAKTSSFKKFKFSPIMKTFLNKSKTPLNSLPKGIITQVLSAISKYPSAANFLYPVNSKLYPEYYEDIETPMDISSIQEKVRSKKYTVLQEIWTDLQLIWDNCRRYNVEGSDIYKDADQLEIDVSNLLEERFKNIAEDLSDATEDTLKRKREVTSPSKARPNVDLSPSAMAKILQQMKAHDCSAPFLEPVDLDEAPGYEEIIKQPMDLKTIGKMLKSGQFTAGGSNTFVSNMNLIWSNCYVYNAPDSEIYEMAQQLENYFDQLLSEAASNSTVNISSSSSAPEKVRRPEEDDEVSQRKRMKKDKITAFGFAITTLISEVSADPRASLFLTQVSDEAAPGYASVIKSPIDLSIIASRVDVYETDPSKLIADFDLLFDNCQAYNEENSEIYQTASELRVLVHEKFSELSSAYSLSASEEEMALRDNKLAEMALLPPVNLKYAKVPPPIDTMLPMYYRVEAETATYLKKYPLMSEAANLTLSLTVAEADKLLEALIADPSGNNKYVSIKAHQLSMKSLASTHLPFNGTNCAVQCFGYIEEGLAKMEDRCLTSGTIAPNGYVSCCKLRVVEDRVVKGRKQESRFLDLVFISFITYKNNVPVYAVALKNGVTVAYGFQPKDVWVFTAKMTNDILLHIGGKLKRCRAVLNRLSTHPKISHFLERVDPSLPESKNYYQVLKAPMWLSEVHRRLVEGAYATEYEFIFDVWLVFHNCISYYKPDSEFYQNAKTIMIEFEQLVCQWVINVMDRSVTDVARGPWDHWAYLRYYDAPTNMHNICRATGEKGIETKMLFCVSCEDQYLPAAINVSQSHSKQNWKCARCRVVEETRNTLNLPLAVQGYSSDEYGWPLFTRAPEIGEGCWFKSITQATRPRVMFVCISPLGERIENAPAAIEQCKKVESAKIDVLIKLRAAEFLKELKTGQRCDFVTRRKMGGVAAATEITRGSLASFDSPDISYDWFLVKTNEEVIPFTANNIPECGYFGIDEHSIKSRIEGMKHANLIPNYAFSESPGIRNSFVVELTKSKEARKAKKLYEEKANESLVKERWFWELETQAKCTTIDRKAGTQITDALTPSIYKNVSALFPEEFSIEEGETLLSVWDFLSTIRSTTTESGISFHEVMKSVLPSENPLLPSIGQVVFDEICCSIVAFLFEDMKTKYSNVDADTWVELLWSKPINILTWPALSNQLLVLSVLSNVFPSMDIAAFLRKPLEGDNLIRLQLLALVVSHPLFSLLVNSEKVCDQPSFDFAVIRQKCFDALITESGGYHSLKSFVADMENLWINPMNHFDGNSAEYATAVIFEEWFSSLLERKSVNCPRKTLPLKQSLRDIERIHPSTWSILQGIHEKEVSTQLWSVTRSFGNYSSDSGFGVFYGSIKLDKSIGPSTLIGEELKNSTKNETEINPACFDSIASIISPDSLMMIKVKKMESSLFNLTISNPEHWSKTEKIDMLSTFVDIAANATAFKDLALYASKSLTVPKHALQAKGSPISTSMVSKVSRVACRDLSDVGSQPRHIAEAIEDFILPKTLPELMQVKCFFSGAEAYNHRNESWVYVPNYLMHTPTGTRLGSSDIVARPVAIKSLLARIASAREVAEEEHRAEQDREMDQLQYLSSDLSNEQITYIKKSVPQETVPLGRDRHGSEYWILGAQEVDTLLPIDKIESVELTEPTVLVRLRSGWWGRHSGHQIRELLTSLSNFIECEKTLRTRLIDRLSEVTKCINCGVVAMKKIHFEWFANQRKVESWIVSLENKLLNPSNPVESTTALIEAFYARCIENRVSTLSAIVNKNECPDINEAPPESNTRLEKDTFKKKRLRDMAFEEFNDLHYSKGWTRIDTFTEMRWLYSSTMASRLLADPTILSLHKTYMQKCQSRKATCGIPGPPNTDGEHELPTESVEGVVYEEQVVQESSPRYTSVVSSRGVKPIEQLDLFTGEILRRYPSGKEAALAMQASQGSISLCCNGLKKDAYNFMWRIYNGPSIDFEEDNKLPGRKSIEELLFIRHGKLPKAGSLFEMHKVVPRESKTNAIPRSSTRNSIPSGPSVQVKSAGEQYQNYSHRKNSDQKHVVSSLTLVDYRLIKIKAELINILLLLPRYLVDFKTEVDAIDSAEKAAEKVASENGETKISPQRELRRAFLAKFIGGDRPYHEVFMQIVQTAADPQELLDCVIFFEKSINPAVLIGHVKSHLPTIATSASAAAIRLYSLDRAIRYEDINSLNLSCLGKYKPRIQYTPRCVVSSTCSKPIGHGGRCHPGFEGEFSRFLEISAFTPEMRLNLQAPTYSPPLGLVARQTLPPIQSRDGPGRFIPPAIKRTSQDFAEEAARKRQASELAASYYNFNYDDIEIETVVPYIPKSHELKNSVWV